MSEKSYNLRDALELVRMLEQLFAVLSQSNEPIPWRGIEITLRQIAMNIVNGSDYAQPNAHHKNVAQAPKKNYEAPINQQNLTIEDENNKFQNRTTILDRVHPSPVSGYKSKNFSPE
jgi:hypothetical protein